MRSLTSLVVLSAILTSHVSPLACVWSCAHEAPRPASAQHHCGAGATPGTKISAAAPCVDHDEAVVTTPPRSAERTLVVIQADAHHPFAFHDPVFTPSVPAPPGAGPPVLWSSNVLRI